MASEKVIACSEALAEKNWMIAFVESVSAGKMSYEFSTVPESGKILVGGMVCYDASMKEVVLEIDHKMIKEFTPESAEVTEAMANNFCKFHEADVCVAVTGLASPGGSESEEKPVGTIFLHFVFPHGHVAKRFEFDGTPDAIIDKAIEAVAETIIDEIESKPE